MGCMLRMPALEHQLPFQWSRLGSDQLGAAVKCSNLANDCTCFSAITFSSDSLIIFSAFQSLTVSPKAVQKVQTLLMLIFDRGC